VVTEGTNGWLPLVTPVLAPAAGTADAKTAIQRPAAKARIFDTELPEAPTAGCRSRLPLRNLTKRAAAGRRLRLVISAADSKPPKGKREIHPSPGWDRIVATEVG
jgi:hypothetical protein